MGADLISEKLRASGPILLACTQTVPWCGAILFITVCVRHMAHTVTGTSW